MTALYCLTKYFTLPGVYMRCFWEQIVCRVARIPVEDNRYLRNDEMCSHIEHEFMPTAGKAFAFCFVPAFMNAIGAFFLAVFPVVFLFMYETKTVALAVVTALSYWFAFSLYCNSYSLVEDAINMMEKIYKEGNLFQKIIFAPGAALLYTGSYLERYCVTFVAAVAGTVAILIGF